MWSIIKKHNFSMFYIFYNFIYLMVRIKVCFYHCYYYNELEAAVTVAFSASCVCACKSLSKSHASAEVLRWTIRHQVDNNKLWRAAKKSHATVIGCFVHVFYHFMLEAYTRGQETDSLPNEPHQCRFWLGVTNNQSVSFFFK